MRGSAPQERSGSGLAQAGAQVGLADLARRRAREVGDDHQLLGPLLLRQPGVGEVGLQVGELRRPSRRVGEPDDIAYAVLYLASDEAKLVTGIELKVDGGISAM